MQNMKAKLFIPLLALCASGPLWGGALLADESIHSSKAKVHQWNLSRVTEASVKDSQGDNLGRIKDVILDPLSGKITFVVIQLSGEVGPKGAYAPVPWPLLHPSGNVGMDEPKTFVLNVDRNQFASAQKFCLKDWPDTNEAAWGP